jgi:hypothetical protein
VRSPAAFVVASGLALAAGMASGQTPVPTDARTPAAGAPVLAVEDSIRQYELPEPVRVRATRVPLVEIIRKAQEGERRKYDGLASLAFTQRVKVTIDFEKPKPYTQCHEIAQRVYYQAPARWREVMLRDEEYVIEADGSRRPKDVEEPGGGRRRGVRVEVGTSDPDDGDDAARSLTQLPDYLERLDRYEFTILHRSVRPDQVVYEIGFEPKSDFEILPEGRMWILTGRYQVVREELRFRRLPLPGILKDVDLVTREWQEIDGRWLQKRITGRARIGLPGFLRAPTAIEVSVSFDQYALNPTLDPALFEASQP